MRFWQRRRPLILLYNRFFGRLPDREALRGCGCRITTSRRLLDRADLVWFHLPELAPEAVPAKRPGQLWATQWQESEPATPLLRYPDLMRRFDITISHRRGSTIWVPYFNRAMAAALRQPPVAKSADAPAALFVSGHHDWCRRSEYLLGLMARLPVDSFGRVFRNRRVEGHDRGRTTKLATIARYRFTLAFENAIEPGYVSEKLFEPLIAGSVPVHRGAPDVADFAPGERCYIDATAFSGPAALAAHLRDLAADEAAYASHLAWKQADLRPAFLDLVEQGCQDESELFARLCRMIS